VHGPRVTAMRVALALLAVSVFINYIDRSNLSVAAPMLKDELGLSASQLGILLSSFFWTYGLFQILSGWLVDRFNVNWVMAAGFFLWSAATSVTGLLHGFAALLVVRLVLGMGESVAYPSYSKIFARHFPESRRGFANALISSGLACGGAFGLLLGGTLMARFGWRSFFIVLGLVSLLWIPLWLRWMPRGVGDEVAATNDVEPAPATLEILKQRSAWGSFGGLFCNAYLLYFLLTWLPFYLVRERHFSMDAMARIGGAVYLTQALCSILCGRLSDRWIAAGGKPTRVRKTVVVAGTLCAATCLCASALAGAVVCVALLILVGASMGVTNSGIWPITQTLAGPQASGRWTGLQCAFGNSSGAIAAATTGLLLERSGHFLWAFALAAGIHSAGALCWMFLVGPIEPVRWRPAQIPIIQIINAETASADSAVVPDLAH
jgi:ACS family D-galactonate transporter-like MFS transporter